MKRWIFIVILGLGFSVAAPLIAQIMGDRDRALRVVEESGQLFQIRIEPNQDDFLLQVNVVGEPIATVERSPLEVRASYEFGSDRRAMNVEPQPGRNNQYIIPDTDVRAFQLEITDPNNRESERFDVEIPE